MPYLAEDDLNVDFSDDDDDLFSEEDDDDGWERESFVESSPRPVYRRKYPAGLRPAIGVKRPVAGIQGGAIRTPAGTAQIKFQKPVATKEAVESLAKRVDEVIKKVDLDLDKNTKVLDSKINAVEAGLKKAQQQMQQTMMLPLLMTTPPKIESITFADSKPVPDDMKGIVLPLAAEQPKYKSDDNTMMLLMLMMMSGGFGGGSQDSTNMMMMALILSGTLK